MNKPKCIIMVGLPGSGKDYWIENVFQSEDYWYNVSTDEWIQRYADANDLTYTEAFNAEVDGKPMFQYAESKMNANLDDLIRDKCNIIWNQTNMSRAKRDKIRRRLNGYDCYVKHIEVSMEQLIKQLVNRADDTGKSICPSIVNRMASSFDPIGDDEPIWD